VSAVVPSIEALRSMRIVLLPVLCWAGCGAENVQPTDRGSDAGAADSGDAPAAGNGQDGGESIDPVITCPDFAIPAQPTVAVGCVEGQRVVGLRGVAVFSETARLVVDLKLQPTPSGTVGFVGFDRRPIQPTVQITRPSDRDWCATIRNGDPYLEPDERQYLLLWIRDVGNGSESLDQYSWGSGCADCLRKPYPDNRGPEHSYYDVIPEGDFEAVFDECSD
jgi:hypothetical protein